MEPERFVVGLIGAGISTSATPLLHESEADALGVRYAYQVIDIGDLGVAAEDVGELLQAARNMGFRGVNVTYPCKQFVVAGLDELSNDAAAIGAVNTVVFDNGRAIGHNTDVSGFRRSFRLSFADAARDRVIVIGAGGAGAAVSYAALQLGTDLVTITDLDPSRAETLTTRLAAVFGDDRVTQLPVEKLSGALVECDGVIHATPTGMHDHPGMPFSPDLLDPRFWVADVVYRPLETELLRQARRTGCRVLDGGGMAVFQSVESFALFTGLEPNPERMLARFDEIFRPSGGLPDDPGKQVAPAV